MQKTSCHRHQLFPECKENLHSAGADILRAALIFCNDVPSLIRRPQHSIFPARHETVARVLNLALLFCVCLPGHEGACNSQILPMPDDLRQEQALSFSLLDVVDVDGPRAMQVSIPDFSNSARDDSTSPAQLHCAPAP